MWGSYDVAEKSGARDESSHVFHPLQVPLPMHDVEWFGKGITWISVIYELNAFMMSFGFKVDETSVFSIQCCQAVWMLMCSFHSYFDCRFARIVWVSALNDATPFRWRQGAWKLYVHIGSQRMLFHLVGADPPTWRERRYGYPRTAERSLPRVSSLLNMQHAASFRNRMVLRRNSWRRLQQGGRHPKRSQHSWPPLAFRCARRLWILLAARSKRCGKLSSFVHQNGRVQAVHFNSPIRLHWCDHGARTTDNW